MWRHVKQKTLILLHLKKCRKIFCQNFNFSFNVPKKDQCHQCPIYEMLKVKGTLTKTEEKMYTEHVNRKDRAREEKVERKELLKKTTIHMLLLWIYRLSYAPCSKVSQNSIKESWPVTTCQLIL